MRRPRSSSSKFKVLFLSGILRKYLIVEQRFPVASISTKSNPAFLPPIFSEI